MTSIAVPLADDARTFHKIGNMPPTPAHARNTDSNVFSCHSFAIPLAALKIAFILPAPLVWWI
jgi:hypothetical protein